MVRVLRMNWRMLLVWFALLALPLRWSVVSGCTRAEFTLVITVELLLWLVTISLCHQPKLPFDLLMYSLSFNCSYPITLDFWLSSYYGLKLWILLSIRMWTMLFWLLAMVLKMVSPTGSSRTHGALTGVTRVTSRWKWARTCAVSIPQSIYSSISSLQKSRDRGLQSVMPFDINLAPNVAGVATCASYPVVAAWGPHGLFHALFAWRQ